MKKQLLALTIVAAATVASYAQGTITFANTVASRILCTSGPGVGGPVPAGTALNYGVFWGAAGAAESALTLNEGALGSAHQTSAGIINAGSPYVIVGGAELSTVSIQIRAWSSSFGRDWETASRSVGALYGKTDVRQVRLAATAGPGTIIWQGNSGTAPDRFYAFTLYPCIPEPTTIGLVVLSLGSLLVFRRCRA